MPDPNEMLADLRAAYTKWAESDPNSAEEQHWGGAVANQFAELDAHLKAGGDLPADWDISAEVPYEAVARELVARGRKIQAIKEVRAVTGWSLREAKDYVDGLE